VAAGRAALSETVADAGLLADPDDPDEFSEAILTAATDASLRTELRERGLRRAATFSWSRTVAELDAAIDRVLD
jgi:alpha-1,3-rhamnosyl/mannosyltransferase